LRKRKEEELRFKELSSMLTRADIVKNPKEYAALSKEYKRLEKIIQKYQEKDKILTEINEVKQMFNSDDEELKEIAELEFKELEKQLAVIENKINDLSNPEYEEYKKNCIVEIRAGTGGDEASLFAADLFRMYTKYIEKKGLKFEVLSSHASDIGGYKEIIFLVSGENAYRVFHFEKGVHRVQRVPLTEAGGRIHTSTVTVAVLPEIEETQFGINQNDLKIDTFRAGGHGGQNVNKVSSAVRISHLPSGIVVTCQDERSQHKNRVRAMKILRARLAAIEQKRQQEEIHQERRQQVGTGERSEKIRTYNYPQNRITDHRMGLSLYKLDTILEGDLESIIENLEKHERNSKTGQ
jgi:peptide chain release factor 1